MDDAELKSKFSTQTAIIFQQSLNQKNELKKICDLLEKEGIPFIVLKGPALRALYPEEWIRASCDIDILVENSEHERAKTVIENKLNYCLKSKNFHDVSLFSPSGVHLELHFSVREHMEKVDPLLERVWDYSIPAAENGVERKLTSEYLIFYIVAHLNRHFVMGGCGIKPFIDLKLLLDKISYDKKELNALLKKAGIDRFFKKIAMLSNVWFGSAEHDEVSPILEEYVLKGGVYGNISNKALVTQIKESKVRAVINKIFLPYPLLCLRYRDKEIKKWQIPYYQLRRLVETVKVGRVGSGINHIKAHASTEKSDVEKIKILMNELGL